MSDFVNSNVCILCQKKKKGEKLSSTENGRDRIREVANSLLHDVYHRINITGETHSIIIETIKSFESQFYMGEIFSSSDVAKMVEEKYNVEFKVKNARIKSCLIDHFDEKVCFIYPKLLFKQ